MEVLYPDYRSYVSSRVTVNDAMTALLAGSKLAAHTLQLTAGSTATMQQLFPAVEHISRFNLRSDAARTLLHNADYHIASVAVPYAQATHEDFVMTTLEFLRSDGHTLVTHGKSIKAWNMHAVLFETLARQEPATEIMLFHVLRELRNCITHSGGEASAKLTAVISALDVPARGEWSRLNLGTPPEDLISGSRVVLTAQHIFTAFAVTKKLGRSINALLAQELSALTWSRLAVNDFVAQTTKSKNSSQWRRALTGYVRLNYTPVGISDSDLEAASRALGYWTAAAWKN